MLRQTAGWVAGHHAEWGGALAEYFRTQLAGNLRGETARTELQTQLARLAPSSAIQDVLAATAGDAKANADTRLLALRAMAAASLKEAPAAWLATLAALLGSAEATLNRQAVATTRALTVPKAGQAAISAALVRVGRSAAVPTDVRLDALAAATPAALAPVDAPLFDFLCAHLDGREPMLARSAAAAVLAKAPLSPAQQLALTETMKNRGRVGGAEVAPGV